MAPFHPVAAVLAGAGAGQRQTPRPLRSGMSASRFHELGLHVPPVDYVAMLSSGDGALHQERGEETIVGARRSRLSLLSRVVR
jgi:hypothetical protein